MTTLDYTNTAATATRLLERFGAAATLKRQTAGAYDPSTGTSAVTTTSLSTTAAVFDYDQKYIDGTLIKQGDKRALIAPAYAPVQGDIFAWASKDWTIVAVEAIAPASTAVLYDCTIRGS